MQIETTPPCERACYRVRRYFRNVGIASTIGFALMGLTSVFASYFNVDKSFARPLLAAAIFGVFWSCFVLLGCWLILFSRRYRLYVDGDSIRQVGVIRDRSLSLSTVNEIKWRRYPAGGSVRIATLTDVMKIDFGNFESDVRKHVISLVRDRTDDARQIGWSEFQRQFEDSPERKVRARRAIGMLIGIFSLHAIAFLVLWGLRFGNKFLFASILNAVFAIYLLRHRNSGSKDGSIQSVQAN